MSFNIGQKNSMYVVVNNVTMRFAYSEKVLFADLRTSQKTGKPKINKETGDIVKDKDGKEIQERVYSHWEGRFMGNAFEPAKALQNGQAINILNGWLNKEESIGKDSKKYTNVFAIITDFELSEPLTENMDMEEDDENNIHMESE